MIAFYTDCIIQSAFHTDLWIIFGVFLIYFFSFEEFLQQHKKTFKSNNKSNNYINQLLKHAQTPTHNIVIIIIIIIIQIIIKRQYQSPSPRHKHSCNTPDEGPNSNSQGKGAVNCCHKPPEVAGILDQLHSYVSAT